MKPKDADWYDWDKFVKWAKDNGVSPDNIEDYTDWWKCWKAAYIAAMNRP